MAIGASSQLNNIASFNTSIGTDSLRNNTLGGSNVAIGDAASYQNTTGSNNISIGKNTLFSNTTGVDNVAIGAGALNNNVSGSGNIAIGRSAGSEETGDNNLYISNQSYGGVDSARSGSLMWGKMDGTAANQTLQINAATNIRNSLVVSGSLSVSGNVLFASGSNKTIGTVALDGANPGSATISNSLVTTSSLIFLTKQTFVHTNSRGVAVVSKGSGTFTISSGHNGDDDVVAYQIINPA
jgi:hypothetical protein